jgi:hypothetical protein
VRDIWAGPMASGHASSVRIREEPRSKVSPCCESLWSIPKPKHPYVLTVSTVSTTLGGFRGVKPLAQIQSHSFQRQEDAGAPSDHVTDGSDDSVSDARSRHRRNRSPL